MPLLDLTLLEPVAHNVSVPNATGRSLASNSQLDVASVHATWDTSAAV